MTELKTYTDQTEANFAQDRLRAAAIHSEILGAKEYVAHVMGGGAGRFKLLVPDDQVARARLELAKIETHLAIEPLQTPPSTYFSRAMILGLGGGFILPVIFNLVSAYNAYLYWVHSSRDRGAKMRLLFLLLAQIPGLTLGTLLLLSFR